MFFVVVCFVMPGGCNFYSNGQAAVNLYEPVVSVYSVLDGAYIRHEPAGVDIKQPVAVPADMYPLGHVVSAIVMCSATIVMYPVGHDVDGVAANEPNGASIKDAASIICFIVPSPCLIGYRLKYTCTEIVIANVFFLLCVAIVFDVVFLSGFLCKIVGCLINCDAEYCTEHTRRPG